MPVHRSAHRLFTTSLLIWAIVVSSPVPPVGAKQTAFPEGRWLATGVAITGGVRGDRFGGRFAGELIFFVESRAGKIADGLMNFDATLRYSDQEGASGSVGLSGLLTLGGTASRVEYVGGSVTMDGSISIPGGGVIPIHDTGPPEGPGFSPSSATCTTVTGDIAQSSRAGASARGLNSSLTMLFVAVRQPDDSTSTKLPKDLQQDINDVLTRLIRTVDQDVVDAHSAHAIAAEVERLHSRILGAAACGDGGSPQGVIASDIFVEQMYRLLEKVLGAQDQYSTTDLLAMFSFAARTGLIGASSPDFARSAQVRDEFVDLIFARIQASTDLPELMAILTAAAQAGAQFEGTRQAAEDRIATLRGGA